MTTTIAAADGRHIDQVELICPACTRLVRPEAASPSEPENEMFGQQWSHLDGSALCLQLSGAIAAPVVRPRRVVCAARGGR
jgi:hypothetical protein